MKKISEQVLAFYAGRCGVQTGDFVYFAGGHEWSDGTVFEFQRLGQTFLCKIIQTRQEDKYGYLRLKERMQYLFYLGSNEVPIIYPIAFTDGELVNTITFEETKYMAYYWLKAQGSHISVTDQQQLQGFYQQWGTVVGSVHRLAKQYPVWRHSLQTDTDGTPIIGWEAEWNVFYHWLAVPEIKDYWQEIRQQLIALPVNRSNFGFIHNDPHSQNLLLDGETITLIDFDVANYHWFMTDIAITLYSETMRINRNREEKPSTDIQKFFLQHFLKGYNQQNKLEWEDFSRLNFFMSYRRILMFAVFYEQIKTHNPEYLINMQANILQDYPLCSEEVLAACQAWIDK